MTTMLKGALSLVLAVTLVGCSDGKALQPPPIKETKDIAHYVDKIAEVAEGTVVEGWAYISIGGQSDAGCSEIFVVVNAGDKEGMFPTEKVPRPDVAAFFKNPALETSGFRVTIRKGAMAKGEYRLGLYIKQNGREALQFSDKRVPLN